MGTLSLLARQHLSWPPYLPSTSPILSPGGSQQVSSGDRLHRDTLLQGKDLCMSRIWELAVMEKNISRGNVYCLKCHLLVHECIGNMIISSTSTIKSSIPINLWKVESYFIIFPFPRNLLLNMSAHSPSIHFLRKIQNTQQDSLCVLFLLFWNKKTEQRKRCCQVWQSQFTRVQRGINTNSLSIFHMILCITMSYWNITHTMTVHELLTVLQKPRSCQLIQWSDLVLL